MRSRNIFLLSLSWFMSAIALSWLLGIIMTPNPYERTAELERSTEAIKHLSTLFAPESTEQRAVAGAAQNLDGLLEGSILIEERGLHIASFLLVLTLGFSSLSLLSLFIRPKTKAKTMPVKDGQNESDKDVSQHAEVEWMLAQTLQDLEKLRTKLSMPHGKPGLNEASKSRLDREISDIIAIEGQLIFIKNQVEQLNEQNQSALTLLRNLTQQSDDFSNYANTTRIEWNSFAIKLAELKEAQGQIRSKSEILLKTQGSSQEIFTKATEFRKIHEHLSERSSSDLERMYSDTKGTTELFSQLTQSISESKGNVDLSNRLVRGLSERAEEIVNIIDVIDDIAEQTNQLALNASIEAARAGEQGKGFAVVAGEVRSLAARSSTATRTITELLETIQTEANQASTSLERTTGSVSQAHTRIQEVEYRCRETMNLSHKLGGDIADLMAATKEHTTDISTLEKQNSEVTRMAQKLVRSLDDIDVMNTEVHQTSSQLAVSTDRIARLMSRHYFAVQNVERLNVAQGEIFKALTSQSAQVLGRTEGFRTQWDDKYRDEILRSRPETAHLTSDTRPEIARLVTFCESNLELLKSRRPTLAVVKNDEPHEDDIDLRPKNEASGHDDADIQLSSEHEKAS